MIYIRFGIAVKDKGGNLYPVKMQELFKFENSYPFGFNIMKPVEWRKWLSEYVNPETGKKLPRKSSNGDPVIYYVYMMGVSKNIKKLYNVGGRFINLFPGYDVKKDGEIFTKKSKSVAQYGRLLP